jgi:hypothetical protein
MGRDSGWKEVAASYWPRKENVACAQGQDDEHYQREQEATNDLLANQFHSY